MGLGAPAKPRGLAGVTGAVSAMSRMRPRRLQVVGGAVLLLFCTYSFFRILGAHSSGTSSCENGRTASSGEHHSSTGAGQDGSDILPEAPAGTHPILHLIGTAEKEMGETLARQSKTLAEAVAEYRRRYGIAPPPHFDKWFAFARERNVQLVDEFDGVWETLLPFWGLEPIAVRRRAAEALGFGGNSLLGLQIREGKVVHMAGAGGEWQRKATKGMLDSFVEHLPDMDLAFNIHDEPRVVVPHGDMARLVHRARTKTLPAASAAADKPGGKGLRGTFSVGRAAAGISPEMGVFTPVETTRFNTYAHQATWTHSRMSCHPDSPARAAALDADGEHDQETAWDNVAAWGLGELGFVRNATALADICQSPSLRTTFGFFDRPNAFSVVQDLFPIFSQSKISSFSDILYPSPWYWYEKVAYDDEADPAWADKKHKLHWRGSTTGGFSRKGGWRRHHRQRMVLRINGDAGGDDGQGWGAEGDAQPAAGKTLALDRATGRWRAQEPPRGALASLFDVSFSHVGQCDPADCEEQERHFLVRGRTQPASAWNFKHLLDVDGNAFSGRFYAFLKSRSLVYKMSLFREWHADWLRPWVHYVPLSLRGDEWLEAVRFFTDEGGAVPDGGGDELAEKMASKGRDWADKVLRNEDLEVWFFRLLLEYGRIVDDDRETIGFSL